MFKMSESEAFSYTRELLQSNLESTTQWVSGDEAVEFFDTLFAYLTQSEKTISTK